MCGDNRGQLDFIDLLAVLSFFLGYENLMENRQQSRQNDVSAANDKQARFLLRSIGQRFDEQDKMIREIYDTVKRLDERIGR